MSQRAIPHRPRALLIVNPGARRAARARRAAESALLAAGAQVETLVTTAPGHATTVARERGREFDVVFTLGGDGTAMEAMTALADTGPPVAILPGGTGNVLARSLGIPMRMARAVPVLLDGIEARIDLGAIPDGRHFAIGLGVGLDEAMIAGASHVFKRRAGVLAYVWAALKSGLRLEKFDVVLTVDGVRHEHRASSVMIANLGSVLGGRISFGSGILHDDGLLHACVYAPANLWEAMRIFLGMVLGGVHRDSRFVCYPGRHFVLETRPPRRAQADGELLGQTPIEVAVKPLAARLLIPRH